jgi:hypothetical protein
MWTGWKNILYRNLTVTLGFVLSLETKFLRDLSASSQTHGICKLYFFYFIPGGM